MTLKDIFLRKNVHSKAGSDDTDATYSIPNTEELAGFRKDAAEGRTERVQAFLDKYSGDYADNTGKYGWSPLKLAEWREHSETAALLRKAQARFFELS